LKRLVIALAALAICVTTRSPVGSAQVSGVPVEISALVPSTGGGAFLAKSYIEAFRAAEIAVNATGGIQGRPLKIVTADSQTSGQVGLQLVNGLIANHAQLFVDGGPSTVCNASAPVVLKTGPVDYCLSPLLTPPAGSFVFSSSAAAADLTRVGVRYFRERGWKRIAVLASTDSSGQALEGSLNAALALPENRDMQLVAREHFSAPDLSVTAQLSRITAANPQALFTFATGTPIGTVFHGLHDAAIDLPIQIPSSNMLYSLLDAYKGFIPRQLYFSTLLALTPADTPKGPIRDSQEAMVRAFDAIHVRPDAAHNLVWDPVMILVAALRHAGPNATAEQIRDYILQLHSWVGVDGVYDFSAGDQRGIGENAVDMALYDIKKGDFVRVSRARGYVSPSR
jgi:branched-chain amino acid transport system substrate-binding protein